MPVLKPGDQRGLARLGEIAGSDLGVAEPVEHAAVDAAHPFRHMTVDDRYDVRPRRLADRQCAEGSRAHLYFTLSTAVFMTESKKP